MNNTISLLTLIFISLNCSFCRVKNNFELFRNEFKEINLPYQINDSLAFNNWDSNDLIDLDYVIDYKLLAKHANKNYPLSLEDYNCSYIGRVQGKNYLFFLYKTFTTEAGRGNPEIILATFSLTGKKIDEITALWDDVEDPFYNQRVMLIISDINTVTIKSINKYNGYLNGEIVPKKITERIIDYGINSEGIINRKASAVKDLFIDNNPNILDDFPTEQE